MHRHCFEALDRTLQDICNNDQLFGGITVLLSGDFRQCLPVVRSNTPPAIIHASLPSSPFWPAVVKLRLSLNMRLHQLGASPEEAARRANFAQWLLDVGNGSTVQDDSTGTVDIPLDNQVHSLDTLISTLYPDIATPRPILAAAQFFAQRAILSTRNDTVHDINSSILSTFPGPTYTSLSADSVHDADSPGSAPSSVFTPDYLNSLSPQGMPTHKLELKVGAPIMLLRNLDPTVGLCNGTRLIITQLRPRVLEARIIGSAFDGSTHFIPRIPLDSTSSSGLPFILRRLQFPVRLAFAMTINKSQGQSLPNVGIHLEDPVFAHGQLYVALSRATDPAACKVVLSSSDQHFSTAKNVVYKQVLRATAA